MKLLLALPFFSVFVQIGLSASFPELRAIYGSAVWASSFLGAAPLGVLIAGPLHGLATRRWGTGRVLTGSLIGWAAASALLVLTLATPLLAVPLRFFLGLCDASLSIAPMVIATKAIGSERERARYYGAFETAASVGAITGPLAVGGLFLVAPRLALAVLAAMAALCALILRNRIPEVGGGDAAHGSRSGAGAADDPGSQRAEAGARSAERLSASFKIPPAMFIPVLFGVATIVVLVAIETALPGFVVEQMGVPVAGKAAVTLFELIAVGGVIAKSRVPGTYSWVLFALAAALGAAFLAAGAALTAVLLVATAFLIGLCLTMSNEYAAVVAAGSEESSMSVYVSFKVSGGFFGPYVAALGTPLLFLPLAGLAVLTGGLILLHKAQS